MYAFAVVDERSASNVANTYNLRTRPLMLLILTVLPFVVAVATTGVARLSVSIVVEYPS